MLHGPQLGTSSRQFTFVKAMLTLVAIIALEGVQSYLVAGHITKRIAKATTGPAAERASVCCFTTTNKMVPFYMLMAVTLINDFLGLACMGISTTTIGPVGTDAYHLSKSFECMGAAFATIHLALGTIYLHNIRVTVKGRNKSSTSKATASKNEFDNQVSVRSSKAQAGVGNTSF